MAIWLIGLVIAVAFLVLFWFLAFILFVCVIDLNKLIETLNSVGVL